MELSTTTISNIIRRFWEDYDWDYASEYGEPGYGSVTTETFAVVLGNYWIRTPDGDLTSYFDKWPRMFQKLSDAGVHFEWYDEWVVDYDRSKAYRCQPDSYSWLPSFVESDGELLTPDDEIETWVEWAADDPRRCLMGHLHSEADLHAIGFRTWPDNETYFESGWHPGQTDDPKAITEQIRAEQSDDVEIVFITIGQGQFDTRFVALTRERR